MFDAISMVTDTRKVYATVVGRRDHLVRKDGGAYDLEDYKLHPEEYVSIFADEVTCHVH